MMMKSASQWFNDRIATRKREKSQDAAMERDFKHYEDCGVFPPKSLTESIFNDLSVGIKHGWGSPFIITINGEIGPICSVDCLEDDLETSAFYASTLNKSYQHNYIIVGAHIVAIEWR